MRHVPPVLTSSVIDATKIDFVLFEVDRPIGSEISFACDLGFEERARSSERLEISVKYKG